MIFISWNLNARIRTAEAQCEALAARNPDAVALQEVTTNTLPILRRALERFGFPHMIDSFSAVSRHAALRGPRRYGVAIASRQPLRLLPPLPILWPEKGLGVSVKRGDRRIHIYSVHIPPGSSNGWTKIEVLEGLYRALARNTVAPRILAGDFNTPQSETPAGEVVTWGQSIDDDGRALVWGRYKGDTGVRWDTAERQVLVGLAEFDLCDVFRRVRGYGCREFSWYLRRREMAIGRRFDHVFASAALKPIRCEYIHAFRSNGLSDHAAIEAEFAA